MGNASKALLIAGEILIFLLVLSVAVYLYSIFLNQSNQYKEIMSETELQKYNSKFDIYVGRKNISAQEVATAFNISQEYNNAVEIKIYNKGYNLEKFAIIEEFIAKFLNSTFSCVELNYDNNTGKIINITFRENS